MVQEEVKIHNANDGSQNFTLKKLKVGKSKFNTNPNAVGIRKVSWLEFDGGTNQFLDNKPIHLIKQISKGSKGSDSNFDQSPPSYS